MKTTLAVIRHLIQTGCAVDWTDAEITGRPADSTVVLFSVGAYGRNGLVLRDNTTGTLYAIAGRCSNLYTLGGW